MKKILIVDDDFFDKNTPRGQQIFEAVEAAGIHIDGINNAAKAVELLKTTEDHALVLMDGEFEGQILQGPGAVAKIREFSNIPIIMISGSKGLNRQGMEEGANDFFDDKQQIADDVTADTGKIAILLRDGTKSQSHLSAYDCAKLRAVISKTLLSLDITLQALAIIHEQPDKAASFLEDFYNEAVDHYKKLDKLLAIADQYRIAKLQKLCHAKSVEKFFNKLVEHTMDAESLLSHDWQLEGIKSFSDWFAAVMDSLE